MAAAVRVDVNDAIEPMRVAERVDCSPATRR